MVKYLSLANLVFGMGSVSNHSNMVPEIIKLTSVMLMKKILRNCRIKKNTNTKLPPNMIRSK